MQPKLIAAFAVLFLQAGAAGPRSKSSRESRPSAAPAVTTVESLGSVSGALVSGGLGFNINPSNEWEFRMAAEAGAIEGRVQFSWEAVESFAGDLALSPAAETALDRFAQYGLQPLIVAGYGPPRRRLLTVSVAEDVAAGSTVVPVNEDVSSVDVPFCHLQRSNGAQIVPEGKWAYYGALIDAVDPGNRTLSLAARTNTSLVAGDALAVNCLRYPSIPTTDPNDPSIAAYGRYVQFLASRVDTHGLTGRVELWNEPPWAHDPWDTRYRFYDSPPPDLERPAVQFGFAALLQTTYPSGNVRYNWAGSHKSGFNSLLGSRMNPHPTQDQVESSMSSESYHPYGNTPEDHAWDPACLADFSHSEFTCHLIGTNAGSNVKSAARYNLRNLIESGWATVAIVGRQSDTDAANSILYVAWQRSYPSSGDWLTLPSPDPAPVTVQLPPGLIAQLVYDLVTRTDVPFLVSEDGQVTVPVADDPIGLLMTPPPPGCGAPVEPAPGAL